MKSHSLLRLSLFLLCSAAFGALQAKDRVPMPWAVRYHTLKVEGQSLRMAFADLRPATANGRTVVLLHGKNFNGWYWREPAQWLNQRGFRVIIPDQLGFGNSDMPDIHYSFHVLAMNTRSLLDSLGIGKVTVIGHSMGGMLATRFSLMFPERVDKLILEDPIGLEDYRLMVPYSSIDMQFKSELGASYESYLKYQKSYYPEWKPRYDSLVRVQALALKAPDFGNIAKANALTFEMIYQQPVCYEFEQLRVPVLLIVGTEDRTVVGKALIPEPQRAKYGNYPELGRNTKARIPDSRLVTLEGIGHIPHIQDMNMFAAAIAEFLEVEK